MCRLHVRMVDLSQYAGQTITNFNIFNTTGGAAGNWDIYFGDITLVHTDGTFIPIYSRSMTSLSPFQGPAETALSVITEKVADMTPLTTTTYYHGDHLGSTQLLTAGTGWPVGGDIYYPYGQGPMPGTNHYLFTDKERDAESQLDYFGARYYASNMGRFMSPDWSAQEEPVPYAKLNDPQSLNLYSYVLNHPLVGIDPDGHACDNANEMAVCHGITVAISNGMNAADALQAGQQAQQQSSIFSLPVVHAQEEEGPEEAVEEASRPPELRPADVTQMGRVFDMMNPGPLPPQVAASFSGGQYVEVTVGSEGWGMDNARVYGGGSGPVGANGTFYSPTPQVGGIQSMMDLALRPEWGNTATDTVSTYIAPGRTVYVGQIASQGGHWVGGGIQVYVPPPQ